VSWQLVDLGSLFEVGSSKRVHQSDWRKNGVPFYRAREVVRLSTDGRVENDLFIERSLYEEYAEKFGVPELGDLLISAVGTLGKVYEVQADDEFYFKDASVIWLRKKSEVDTSYIKWALRSSKVQQYIQNYSGATVGTFTISKAKKTQIPLPPLAIQKQIAAVLDKANKLRQQSQQMEQELNSLAQSVFLDKFGDPKSNPKRWQKRPLKSILEKLVGGKSLAAPEQHTDVSEYRVLKISAVTSGQYNPSESKALPADYIPPKEHFVQVNDLLFSRANTTELVGATTMVFDTPENLLLPDKLWKFQWKESEPLSQIFMWKLLSSKAMRHRLSEISSGSGGSMKNISKSKLLELEVIFPDYEKQMEYENFYLRLRDQILLNKEYISQAEGQFDSLMQRAFKGELEIKDVA